jgi:putative membrane protein
MPLPWLLSVVVAAQIGLGLNPSADRMTWALENAPVWIGVGLIAATHRRFPLSSLCLHLFALHSLILALGGHYTYARVPVGDWARDTFGFARNHYDRVGHLAQGFIPAIFVRELLLRKTPLRRGVWLNLLVVSVCLAFSACYEFVEWWTALLTGDAATDFLGTQGDPWDTQWDMWLALLGAIASLALLRGWHDRSLRHSPGVADPHA